MTEDKETKKEKTGFVAVQVPTQHVPAIQTPEGEIILVEGALSEILNKLSKIEKLLG